MNTAAEKNCRLKSESDVVCRPHRTLRCCTALLALLCCCSATQAQQQGYHPMHHNMPPGQAAAWLNSIRGYNPGWLQPLRVELPTSATISVYSAGPEPVGHLTSPAQFSVNAGHYYRLRLADMPEFPGAEVFPTIELLDHLHPPAGLEHDFPIPIVFSTDDIRLALDGQLVTRVVYLEQPQLASTRDPLRSEIPQSVSPADNALHAADRLGRPMAIVRIGGRIPMGPNMPLSYYGTGGAVDLNPVRSAPAPAGVARLSNAAQSGAAMVRR